MTDEERKKNNEYRRKYYAENKDKFKNYRKAYEEKLKQDPEKWEKYNKGKKESYNRYIQKVRNDPELYEKYKKKRLEIQLRYIEKTLGKDEKQEEKEDE